MFIAKKKNGEGNLITLALSNVNIMIINTLRNNMTEILSTSTLLSSRLLDEAPE